MLYFIYLCNEDTDFELTFLESFLKFSFPKMFRDLEDSLDNLGIQSFGVSVTTMEEVFLK